MVKQKSREINFECLRILSMVLIVVLHCLSYGGARSLYKFGDAGFFVLNVIRSFCYLGVNCFVLISGFFLYDKKYKLKRIIKLYIETFIYL